MPQEEQEPTTGTEGSTGKTSKPWFTRNRGGMGFHPSSWQGVLTLAAGVAVIVVIVVLLTTGVP